MNCSEIHVNCVIPKGFKHRGMLFNYKHFTPAELFLFLNWKVNPLAMRCL